MYQPDNNHFNILKDFGHFDERFADEYFEEYVSLGGKKNRRKYDKNVNIFFEETYDIFINGNPIKHESREDSMYAVSEIANIPMKEVNLIFESVDNVTSYT